ncbi:hypothetical protein DENIS_4884 [Desulfonema ishimotonii]|uniref:Uncharacterized protein n=1 Tax=Desulfonema ishimotonii TaxID=45657 RepID=A0A401G439_9BACT|nr:hypothetical protein DENIS_4884 [Desulfonema ishimotonii]
MPNPFDWPQSGQTQVMPLQESPQTLSFMQSWHMVNPHRHCQLNAVVLPQQWHGICLARRRFSL